MSTIKVKNYDLVMEYKLYGATGLCFSIPSVILNVMIFLVILPSF